MNSLTKVAVTNFVSAFLGFVFNVWIARILEVDDYGRAFLLISASLMINQILDFGLSNAYLVILGKEKKPSLKKTHVILGNLIKASVLRILFFSVLLYISSVIFEISSQTEFYFLFVCGFVSCTNKSLISFFQGLQKWNQFNYLNLSLNVLKIAVLGLYLSTSNNIDIKTVLASLIIATIIHFGIILWSFNYYLKFSRTALNLKRSNKKIFLYVKPFFVLNVITVLASRMDLFLTENMLSSSTLANYSAAISVAFMFPLVTSSILQVLIPRSSSGNNSTLFFLKRNFKTGVLVVLVFTLVGILLSKPFFEIVFSNKYENAHLYFSCLMPIFCLGILFTPFESYFYAKNPWFLTKVKSLQLAIILIVSVVFMNFGIWSIISGVYMSRFFGWSVINIAYNKSVTNVK